MAAMLAGRINLATTAPDGIWFPAGVFLSPCSTRLETLMAGEADKLKGRAKEAAGAITDNDRLRREGKVDQAAGKVKNAASKAVDKVKKAFD